MTRKGIVAWTATLSAPLPAASVAAPGSDHTADQIAQVIDEAAPGNDTVVAPTSSFGEAVSFTTVGDEAANEVLVSLDPSDPVVFGQEGARGIEVSLPDEVTVDTGTVADDGSIVYEDNGADAHAAVQALDDGGVRLQTVLEGPDAPQTYTYDFASDVFPIVLEDGSVELVAGVAEGARMSVGQFDAPWAKDANGSDVETWYTAEGNSLVQHVVHDEGSAYPITADPKGTRTWWNTTLYFNRKETKLFAAGTAFTGTVTAWFPTIPTQVVGRLLQVYAGTFGVYFASGKCGKLVTYAHVANFVPQPYSGKEAGGYCR
ncbi:hypothetical protein SAMN04489860_0074 [Paraoerskovia marina]|uniref:Uncharacterized protein n=1 Tax=Paraoerskovia marina TaxID=545619 RepID=A0A1H1M0A3_9CELL|nr:hypothetical protein SAMN04489860_0074 [Paraoerskovia marina]